MAGMSAYTARAERDEGGWWVVTVPELPGVFTQARRLDRVDELARDAIALWLEVPTQGIDVAVEASVPDLDEEIAETTRARRQVEQLRDEAGRRSRHLARELAARGLTVRDIGQVLGVSYQRASQLLDSKAAQPAARRRAPAKRRTPIAASTASSGIGSRKAVKKSNAKKKPASR
jgi:predicted RNase H-like HicB family nuclease